MIRDFFHNCKKIYIFQENGEQAAIKKQGYFTKKADTLGRKWKPLDV